MYKTKIFFGIANNKADDKFNKWSEDNPDIVILNFKYQQARYGDHSICILYKEK